MRHIQNHLGQLLVPGLQHFVERQREDQRRDEAEEEDASTDNERVDHGIPERRIVQHGVVVRKPDIGPVAHQLVILEAGLQSFHERVISKYKKIGDDRHHHHVKRAVSLQDLHDFIHVLIW